MVDEELSINSLKDLPPAASQILKTYSENRIFAIGGEMGAGKTTLIKELCHQLKVTDTVSSPTFALVNEYHTADQHLVYHFDFYRINSENEAFDIGIREYFDSGDYCFIEWPEKVLNLLPEETIRLHIDIENNKRVIKRI